LGSTVKSTNVLPAICRENKEAEENTFLNVVSVL
jgi:hypothetical protein